MARAYLQECEPTLPSVALVLGVLSALSDEHPAEPIRVLRGLTGSF
jgi:hypothetical protein